MRINNHERELWVLNDQVLYRFWKMTNLSMTKFLKEYRKEIDNHLKICNPGVYE